MDTGMVTDIIRRINRLFSYEKTKITTDIHSHLLPGIDDGSKSLDESIKLIEKFISLGYKKLIITPHVMSEGYNNPTSLILEKYNLLKEEINKRNLDIKIEVAVEYMLDEEFLERLEKKDILTFGKNFLLFETSYYQKPLNFEHIIFKIKSKGYVPVLAHPERYRYMELRDYEKLKELELLFQCNINSFGGFYGKNVQKKVKYIAKKQWIDFLGSDCHSMKYLNFMQNVLNDRNFHKNIEHCNIKNEEL
jgi:tyrosine-protein phosphatase YwqE